MKQIFSNNSKSTLSTSISSSSLTLSLVDASSFPTPATSEEFYYVTLEVGTQIEVCRVTGKSGSNLTLLSTGDRGLEGTTAATFPAGSKVEVRVTKGTLDSMSKALVELSSVDSLVKPSSAYNTGYIIQTFDPFNNPVVAIRKDANTWGFLTYTPIQIGAVVTSSTTTSVTAASITITTVTPGDHLIQFTSGALSGQVRVVSSNNSTTANWVTVTGSAPVATTTFDLYKSNAVIINALGAVDLTGIADDAIMMPIILGG